MFNRRIVKTQQATIDLLKELLAREQERVNRLTESVVRAGGFSIQMPETERLVEPSQGGWFDRKVSAPNVKVVKSQSQSVTGDNQ